MNNNINMTMRKIFTTLVLGFTFLLNLNAQNQANSSISRREKEGLNLLAEEQYTKARPVFEILYKEKPDNESYLFNLALCEYMVYEDKSSSIEKFEKIVNLYRKTKKVTDYSPQSYFYLGEAYHEMYMFDEAIGIYSELEKLVKAKEDKATVARALETSKTAKAMYENTDYSMFVTRLGNINSGSSDHTAMPTENESLIIFTSRREGGTTDKLDRDDEFFEDIWIYDKSKGVNSIPYNLRQPVNNEYHDATAGLAPSGRVLFIHRSSRNKSGDLYMSVKKDTFWTDPVKMDKTINSKFTETHICISPDEKTVYFSSDRRKGKGGRDIWISTMQDDGKWGKAKNFSHNTAFDEESPYLMSDGKTLYFSSRGLKGMGGYDIYKCVLQDDGSWSEPENLNFPINTVGDDVFYFPVNQGKKAYFTRKVGGMSDIFISYMNDAEDNNLLMTGIVMDNNKYFKQYIVSKISGDSILFGQNQFVLGMKKKSYMSNDSVRIVKPSSTNVDETVYFVPKKDNIQVFDADKKTLVEMYKTSTLLGDYTFLLSPGNDYKIAYVAPNHIFDSRNINTKTNNKPQTQIYNAVLVKIEEGKTEKYKNTPFMPNSSDIVNQTDLELGLIEKCMKDNPPLFVSFSTNDFREKTNAVSEKRKEIAINYLTSKGISKERIYTDLSPRKISGDSLEYTIYDAITLQKAIDEKKQLITDTTKIVVENKDVLIELEDLLFAFNKDNLSNITGTGVDKLIEFLKANPTTNIIIIGYADAVGSDEYNKRLSQKRAKSVSAYFTEKGVKPSQIEYKGYGEENPIALNKKANGTWFKESQKYNRRVEFIVVNQGKVVLKLKQFNVPAEFKDKDYIENKIIIK